MSSRVVAMQRSAADWLADLAEELAEREQQPHSLVVLALSRGAEQQVVEHFSGPGLLAPTEFFGIVELAKVVYVQGDDE